jgi:hypothetical protein
MFAGLVGTVWKPGVRFSAVYDGQLRASCTRRSDRHRAGRFRALLFQFGSASQSGLKLSASWPGVALDKFNNAELVEGVANSDQPLRPASCITDPSVWTRKTTRTGIRNSDSKEAGEQDRWARYRQ